MSKLPVFRTLEEACAAVGIEPAGRASSSGFVSANVCGDRHGKGDGRIKFFPNVDGGLAWNWKTGCGAVFFGGYTPGRKVPREEWLKIQKAIRAAEKERAKQEAARHDAVAALAASIMAASRPSSNHPYLERKRVSCVPGAPSREIDRATCQRLIDEAEIPFLPGEERQRLPSGFDRLLLVPLRDERGRQWSLQMIACEEGHAKTFKSFLKGGRIKGCFWLPEDVELDPKRPEPIAIAEGVATALAVRKLYGVPCGAAMSAGNLQAAAGALRNIFLRAEIWVMGDNDLSGTGQEAANKAAQGVPPSMACVCPAEELTPEQLAAFRRRTGDGAGRVSDYDDYLIATMEGNE